MTIHCKTGCGSQVTYEIRSFSDGFNYFLPLNPDRTIHNCPNVPSNYEEEWPGVTYDESGNMDLSNNYYDLFTEMDAALFFGEKGIELMDKKPATRTIIERSLRGYQIESVVLPLLFYQLDTERDSTFYQLTAIAESYKQLGDYDNALLALVIQNSATNDQFGRIDEILKTKQYQSSQEFYLSDENNVTVELIIRKIEKIEKLLKIYLRKKFQNNRELFVNDKTIQKKTQQRLTEQIMIEEIIGNIDKIDAMTLGEVISLITFYQNEGKFPEFTKTEKPFLELILQYRNIPVAHSTAEVRDRISSKNNRFWNTCCDKLLEHLKLIEGK